MNDYRVQFDRLSWETPIPGLRLKAMRSAGKQLRLVEYTPDMEPHWCEKGHIGYVLDGEFEITFKDQTALFKPGDGVFIPNGAEHRHMGKALTDVVRVIFVEDI